MAVSETVLKIYLTAAKKRAEYGENIDDILNSMNKLNEDQKNFVHEELIFYLKSKQENESEGEEE